MRDSKQGPKSLDNRTQTLYSNDGKQRMTGIMAGGGHTQYQFHKSKYDTSATNSKNKMVGLTVAN